MVRDQIFYTDKDRGITNYEKGTSLNNKRMNEETKFYREEVSLAVVDKWFDEEILPKREVAWFDGNPFALDSNPNGVCSQAAQFVIDKYYEVFQFQNTTDGYTIGQIVWYRFEDWDQAFRSNHTAAVMIKRDIKGSFSHILHKYELKKGKLYARMEKKPQYSEQELLQLHVYDLFNKRRVPLKEWISMVESFGSKHLTSNWIKLGTNIQINQ